jgi:tetratricopeptide (TPR) repeat protein
LGLVFLGLQTKVAAQNRLSTPLEILTFMKASGTNYQIEQLRGKIERPHRQILQNDGFVDVMNGREYSRSYPAMRNCKAEKWANEAQKIMAFENLDRKKARKLYLKAIKEMPQDAQLYALIGESFYDENDYPKAKDYFRKAIAINAIDYRSHWLLGEIYLAENVCDSAIYYISLAHLRNRNLPRLQLRLKEVYKACGKNYYQNWAFEPLYRNYREDTMIVIAAQGVWLTYAMYKAVWEFEPDYLYIKSKQQVTDYLYHQEMEGVMGMYLTYNNLAAEEQREYASLRAFELALDNELLEAYIFYEILLPERPTLAQYLTPEFTAMLLDYMSIVRGAELVE